MIRFHSVIKLIFLYLGIGIDAVSEQGTYMIKQEGKVRRLRDKVFYSHFIILIK